jgi:hypothetical protein
MNSLIASATGLVKQTQPCWLSPQAIGSFPPDPPGKSPTGYSEIFRAFSLRQQKIIDGKEFLDDYAERGAVRFAERLHSSFPS